MKIAIVGLGSIGLKHYNNFLELGCDVAVVSKRTDKEVKRLYSQVAECEKSFKPEVYFICNNTSEHYPALKEIKETSFHKMVILEKPIFQNSPALDLRKYFSEIRVSYNFRFNPLLKKLKMDLAAENIISAQVYVGQYLPQWRPAVDYRASYSASAEKGGGVLLDLSHELDYIFWLLGPAAGLFASGGKLSELEITSEDLVNILFTSKKKAQVAVQLNYLDRVKNRFVILNTDKSTYKLDFVTNEYFKNEVKTTFDASSTNNSYIELAKDIISNKAQGLATYEEAVSVLNFITECRNSMKNKKWIDL